MTNCNFVLQELSLLISVVTFYQLSCFGEQGQGEGVKSVQHAFGARFGYESFDHRKSNE